MKEFTDDLFLLWKNIKTFYCEKSFLHKQAKTMEEFMIHLIRNEGIFDLFLNDDEKDLDGFRDKDFMNNKNEPKIHKKRGRKPKNFIETERLKELEKINQNKININSDVNLNENNIYNLNKYLDLNENSFLNKAKNSFFEKEDDLDKNSEKMDPDICVEI